MAEITRRRTGELLRKLFDILMTHSYDPLAAEALVQTRHSRLPQHEKRN